MNTREPISMAAKQQSGFTLVEMLVGLTLLVTLMGLVYAGMRVGLKSWERVDEVVAERTSDRALRNLLRRQFQHLTPLVWRQGTRQRVAFAGARDRVKFLAPLAHREFGGGLYLVEISAQGSRDSRQLRVRFFHRDPQAQTLVPGEAVITRALGQGFRSIRFRYFGDLHGSGQGRWHDRWGPGAVYYPRLVRIEMAGEDEHTETLTLPLRVSGMWSG